MAETIVLVAFACCVVVLPIVSAAASLWAAEQRELLTRRQRLEDYARREAKGADAVGPFR